MTITGYWALPRPMTRKWGSGEVWNRICKNIAIPDVAFGKTDGIPDGILAVDLNTKYNWLDLPFEDNIFAFGYWDPPYDRLYKPEGVEIWRTCRMMAVLHEFVYPTSWFANAKRTHMYTVTFGPLKRVRALQVFTKTVGDRLL